ncbi:YqiA/YcfP family alpha/beta fold hydrolase [Pseudomonas sp. KNUC1026]|uniref:YqiA/YcfP family alpha/beta fold hydrolase n=1 Tax=Pseudomonas sp. KNUC1026 TaxID=2893890 RepID=UPI001F2B9F2A|nr:YqiA/YcfP family alpha/beta fold hydrolase [Pseudomonas sp. KNUC1026]UFH49742.1 esterase [Pseudomonas sp. KNUC1026]
MSSGILYIHGLNSSPLSVKAQQLSEAMAGLGAPERLLVPALHHHPRQAMVQLQQAIDTLGGNPLLVGSSLGGYYATHLAHRLGLNALLINPAVNPHRLFDGHLGTQANLYSGETWELTLDHIAALAELEVPPPERGACIEVWLQAGDETLDYRHAVQFYQGCVVDLQPGGDHSYQGFAERLPRLLALAGLKPDSTF